MRLCYAWIFAVVVLGNSFVYAHEAAHEATHEPHAAPEVKSSKPSPEEALQILKQGNARFIVGTPTHPHADAARLKQAGSEKQANYAYATVLTCSDSRIPVERIFDAGIMDLFVVRTAGNVCSLTERASIEYGIMHVNTPLLVVMGHTQCGAVTASTQAVLKTGEGHALERNIPPLLNFIHPAVQRALLKCPKGCVESEVIVKATEENVWGGIEALLLASPAIREQVQQGKVKIIGAIYDVGTGKVNWMPETTVFRILGRVEVDPRRETDAFADGHGEVADGHGAPAKTESPAHAVSVAAKSEHGAPKDPHGKPADDDADVVMPPLTSSKIKPASAGHGEESHGKAAHGEEAETPKAAPKADPHGKTAEDSGHDEDITEAAGGHGEKPADKKGKGEKEVKVAASSEHESPAKEASAAVSERALPGWVLYASGLVFLMGVGLMVVPGILAKRAAKGGAGHAPATSGSHATVPAAATQATMPPGATTSITIPGAEKPATGH